MRLSPRIATTLLCTVLFSCISLNLATAQQKDENFALQRGYRTGYSDGYMAGYRDTLDAVVRNYERHEDYSKADRTYSKDYGSVEEFRDGYQQGFEAGYNTGYDKKSFESTIPATLKKRGVIAGDARPPELVAAAAIDTKTSDDAKTTDDPKAAVPSTVAGTTTADAQIFGNNATILIPKDTELILEMQTDVSTEKSREGDKFTAKVVSPSELAGATIEGRVSKVTHPGRIKRRSELSLSFDRIILSDNRWSNLSGSLIEVMPVKGDNIRRVDEEGTAIGQSTLKGDAIKIGGATTAGLITGAIIGGPVGAGVGAGVGAAFGVGAVVIERGKHVNIKETQQMRIRTEYETQIR